MTIAQAVDALKVAAMKLNEENKNLLAAKKTYEKAKEQESAARGRYALALRDLEEQAGADI